MKYLLGGQGLVEDIAQQTLCMILYYCSDNAYRNHDVINKMDVR